MNADIFTRIFWILLSSSGSAILLIMIVMRDDALILLAADFPSNDAVFVSEARFVGL